MSDVNANIGVQIDTSSALTELKNLQRQLANFHASIAKTSAAATAAQKGLQTNLLNSINATGQFTATMGNVRTSTESFTHALESNKLSMREYFRYAGGASKTFGRLFKQEFDTIGKVAEERVKKMQTQYIKMGRDANGAIKAMAITPQTLNMNDYATKTALAAQKQALFNQVVKQGSTSLLNFGKNTQWAGRQLMVGFTIPLAYFGTTASKVFMDLEAQAIKFKRVYGDLFTTSEQTNKALEDVRKLAEEFTKYGVAVSKTMEMASSAAAMGKTGADLTAQVAQATRLAVLGNVEQEQALETTISLTNAFGIAAEDLASKINFLNSVENQTVVSIEDLTIAIPKAGPVVQQLGGDVEDLAFFLTAMKEGGINASEGANALKSGLASLINPSKKASEMLAGLGINIKGIVEANKGDLKNTVIGFAQALDTLAPLDRSRAIEQLFGKFQFARLSTLFQNITKDGTQASKVLQLAGASVEELAILSERELKTVEDAVGTKFKGAVEELKLAIAPIGKTFLEAVTPIVKIIGNLLDKFNGLGDGTKKFIVIATTLVGIIGPTLLMTFGLLANGAANIIKLFLALRGGFLKVGGNSKILAEQTNYLNAEQLESATVAASLNQAHTRLTQSFTAESSAVRALRNAYIEATVAAANFARSNPGMMMMPKGSGKGPKKFADGTTGLPGPKGAGDIIPILGAPGEAIIPANVAQDNRFKPIIDAMVNGKLQGFEEGTVNLGSKSFRTSSQKTARDLENTIAQLKSQGIPEEKIVWALERNIERGRPMNATQLKRRLSIGRGSSSGSSAPSSIRNLAKQSQSGFLQETEAVKKALQQQGVALTPAQEKNLFNVQASHIEETRNAGVKEWKANNLVADLGYVNNYLNTVKGKLGTDLLKMSDSELQKLGIDRKELQKLQSGVHPTTADAAKTLRSIAQYDSIRNPGSYQAKAVVAGLEHRAKNNFYAQPMKTLAETQPISSRVEKAIKSRADLLEQERNAKAGNDSEQLMKQIDKDIRKTALGKQAPTNFGKQISPTTGHSFPVKGLGGIYEKPDGSKVFVKPVLDAKAALAEQRATIIAREAHGLDSPKQEIKTMIDPTDPTGKRKLIVLESAFDPKFDPNKMTNKFTKDEYFKQLVAANLRGDKDLGRGNLSGNVLADVGTAGVFEKASGKRDFAKIMPSMAEQAKINLLGVKGGAKKFFAESTLGIPKGMTADEYHNRMIKEIDKVLPKLKSTISKFDLSPAEREVYSGMITRLEEGKKVNWREFHKIHSSVLATKKEALQDEKTGKITSIKGKAKPKNILSSTGKSSDRVMTQVPVGKKIVQDPRRGFVSRFGSKTILPGYANAPSATGVSVGDISQSQRLSRAQLLAATEKISLKQAKKRIAAESKLTSSMEENTKAQLTAKEKVTQFSNKAGLGIGAMSGLTIAASFAGGQVGELAQKIMPFVFGLQGIVALLPMLMNPWVALVAGITTLVVGAKLIDSNNKKMAQKQSDYIDSISATTNKMKSVGEITGKVGASELMARRRADSAPDAFSKQYDRAGQQFGTNFMGSEIGKEISKGFSDNLLNGRSSAVKQFALQLSGYVSDGVIDGVQAGDIARQIAVDFQDMTLYPAIIGELTSIIGPDGANILKDPLKIRIKIINEQSAFAGLTSEGILTNKGGGITTLGSFGGGASNRIGLTEKSSAATAAAYSQTLELAKAQVDATEVQYQKDLQILQAKKNIAKTEQDRIAAQKEIDTLTNKNKTDNVKLGAEIAKILKDQETAFDKTSRKEQGLLPGQINYAQNAFIEASKKQVTTKFKGTQLESQVPAFLETTKNLASKDLEIKINALAASGTNPVLLTGLMQMFKGDEKALNKQIDLGISTRGVDETIALIGSLGNIKDEKLQKELFVKINAIQDKGRFGDLQSTLTKISEMTGKDFDINTYLKVNGFAKLDALSKTLRGIQNVPDPITKTTQIENTGVSTEVFQGIVDNWEYFMSLPETVRKNAITTYTTAYDMVGPDQVAGEIKKRLAGARGRSAAALKKYYDSPAGQASVKQDLAAQATKPQYVPGQPKPKPGVNPKDQTTPKERDTTLDDLLKKLKLTRDASINAEGGLNELRNVFKKAGGDVKIFNGLEQALSKLGADSGFIDFIGGMDNATEKGYVNAQKLKKGIIELTDDGKIALKGYQEAQLGAFSSASAKAITELQNQRSGFVALKSAGLGSADALEMISDANFAVSLRAAKTTEEVKKLTEAFKKQRQEEELTLSQTDPQQYFDNQITVANRELNFQEAMARRTYEPQIAATEELIKANNVLIEQAQRKLEMDSTYGSRQIDKINAEIESLNRQIATGIDATLQQLSVESAKLAEDQTTIGHAVDAINEKYDLQEKALAKISELNQDIIAEKKTQISLADALTQGDISAAAQAAQDVRSASASRAQQLAADAMTAAREAQIAGVTGSLTGKTSAEIAERQYQIDRQNYLLGLERAKIETLIAGKQEEIYKIEQLRKPIIAEITRLEDLNYNYNNNVIPALKIKLQAELDAVEAQRTKWTDAQLAIDKANLSTEDFKTKLGKANTLLTTISGLWASITDKNLQVTITTIENVIKNNAIGTTAPEAIDTLKNATTTAEVNDAVKRAAELGGSPSDIANAMVPGLRASGMTAAQAAETARWTGQGLAWAASQKKSKGGFISAYMASGGLARGTDTVPAMLTPGEFVVNAKSAQQYGGLLKAINTPGFDGMRNASIGIASKTDAQTAGDMYNYNIGINVTNANANSDDIARAVIGQIKYIDSQRIRGQR